jgi:hypothetical protein
MNQNTNTYNSNNYNSEGYNSEIHNVENQTPNAKQSRPRTTWLWRIFLLNLVLVGAHLGEFWPFSIFPMFSKAGQPWSRAMVVETPLVDSDDPSTAEQWEPIDWAPKDINILDLQAISLDERGIDKIDFSNYVGKTEQWTPEVVSGIAKMIPDRPEQGKAWLVLKVRGRMDDGTVGVQGEPIVAMTADTVVLSPNYDNQSDNQSDTP